MMVALVPSLIASACLMAAAVASRDYAWLGWLCLLPLFFAIRTCAPLRAALCGALWGGCLYIFLQIGTDLAAPTLPAFALLTLIPALYAYLGACLTRWIGFSPFVLAVGWMGVELATAPLGLRSGLLADTQGGGTLMAWVGQGLGYAFVGFIVAVVNASLASVLSSVRLSAPRRGYRVASRDHGAPLLPQTSFCFPLFAISPSQPRAPPAYRPHNNRTQYIAVVLIVRTCERVCEVRNSGFDKKQTHRREMRMKTLFMQVICATTILCLSSATFAADPACSACGPGANWINACDPGGPDNMDSTGEVGIYLADDCSDEPNSFVLAGPALVTRQGSGGTDTIATEITSMNLVGGGLTLLAGAGQGDITQASTGSIVENGGDNTIGNSSFDVFFEADVPGVGLVWNHTALNVMAAITCVPPRARYFHPKGQCIPLYNDPDVGQGVVVGYLGNARHTTFVPAVSDWGVVAMALLVLAAGTVVIRRWRRVPA